MIEKHDTRPYWRRIALPASIFLNLFLLAVIGGHLWHDHGNRAKPRTLLAHVIAKAEASLPSEEASAFGAVLRRDAPNYLPAQQRLTEARRELVRQITAEQFNKEGVRQALAAWSAAWRGFVDDFGDTLIEALAQISPEGRNKLIAERWSGRSGLTAP